LAGAVGTPGLGFPRRAPTASTGSRQGHAGDWDKTAVVAARLVPWARVPFWLSGFDWVGGSGPRRNKDFDYSEKNFYATQNSIENLEID
jgi:hypothetical protein